ncbi:S24 family peptidase [Phenylobacterium sp.]|jgi:phage repressor protein C with HTH and peptisase S24 domain|uniref:S24 family peptidase n=1 Tax=Phenylobacterium sp. TaxID=1871053 RepID=UPI002F3EC056
MQDLLDWQSVAQRLEGTDRGTRTRLAERLKMDRSQLARTLKKGGPLRVDQLQVVEAFLTDAQNDNPNAGDWADRMRVPLYGFAAGSDGERFALNDGQILDMVDLPRGMSLKGEFFVVQAIGSSMEPRIWPGERKLVQRGVPPGRDQDAILEFHDGTAVLKTYKRERDGQVFVAQYNPEKEVRYDASSVRAIHAILTL